MNMVEWAEREVELAKKRENPNLKEGEWDYGCACYDSALKAYKSLAEDGHSGLSISITKLILNRLIDGNVLTPIEDREEDWNECGFSDGKTYQHKRYSKLFKTITDDGTIEYKDNGLYSEEENGFSCHFGFVDDILRQMYPVTITFPYMPPDKPYVARIETFLEGHPEVKGSFDHIRIYEVIEPDGTHKEIKGHRYKEVFAGDRNVFIPIKQSVWDEDKAKGDKDVSA